MSRPFGFDQEGRDPRCPGCPVLTGGTDQSASRYLRPLCFSIVHKQPCWLTAARLLIISCYTLNNLWGALIREAGAVVLRLMGNVVLDKRQLAGDNSTVLKSEIKGDMKKSHYEIKTDFLKIDTWKKKLYWNLFHNYWFIYFILILLLLGLFLMSQLSIWQFGVMLSGHFPNHNLFFIL